ncbi:hypothetical protein [Caballeronia arvi]|uniref:hypothetical protein n=1 Tax=Caballeronia arvi TaxID=1777135 RepID=UPI00118131EE|nr:hypothetical protein [Caballeronia arvi]
MPFIEARTVDYSAFKFGAVVDWLAFEIETASPTHGGTIFKCPFEIQATGKTFRLSNYVTPLNKASGGVATRFRVRFQDVASWEVFQFPEAAGRNGTVARADPRPPRSGRHAQGTAG